MDRSRHSVTKYLNDEKTHRARKTHRANNIKLLKRLNFITDQLYEVELVKSKIEHGESIIVGFFLLPCAKLRMLELCYYFFKKFFDTEKYEELELDTDSLFLALLEENLEEIILPEKRNECEEYVREIVQIASVRLQRAVFFQEHVVLLTRSMIRESRDCLKKNSGVPKCCACVAKPIVATIERVTNSNSVARDSIKELWNIVEMDTCQSIEKC